ncbi:MAG: hypothetical protein AAF694_28485 [Bacteroidota bacterium]
MTPLPSQFHTFEVLYEKGDHKVVYCLECEAFHIYYGTVSLDLYKSSLESLLEALKLYRQTYEELVPPTQRCIEVVTPFEGIRLLFSIEDLDQFSNMLRTARRVFEEKSWRSHLN